jgi:hypothetical protein
MAVCPSIKGLQTLECRAGGRQVNRRYQQNRWASRAAGLDPRVGGWYHRLITDAYIRFAIFFQEKRSGLSSIQKAIGQLFESLDRLESAASRQEQTVVKFRRQSAAEPQIDLFAGMATAFAIDPAVVARKLDNTIDKIEKLLQEG